MTKIFTAEQMAWVDGETAKQQCVSSFQLMERAAGVLLSALESRYVLSKERFVVVCGKGNNGGDGLVLAQYLRQRQAKVSLYLLDATSYSQDNKDAQKRNPVSLIQKFAPEDQLDIPDDAIILDCLFGYGMQRGLDDSWHNIVGQINNSGCKVIAVDMPSGLSSDGPTPIGCPVVYAHEVLTFQSPKLALLMPDNQSFFEGFEVLDIGLTEEAMARVTSDSIYVTKEDIQPFYKRRKKFGHKGVFGHVLLMGGSYGKIGAVQLASKAALRSGCGLLSSYVPRCGYSILQTAVPEAMLITDEQENLISSFPDIAPYQAMGLGVGMGTEEKTKTAFREFLTAAPSIPMVLDADALNVLAQESDLLASIPLRSILTPHPKELKRIIGDWNDDWHKIEKTRLLASQYNLCVLIKGANSAIVLPDGRVYFNSTGNVGMATGGSGDALTGILTALLGQGYSTKEAAVMGVYLHGRAADIAVAETGVYSLLPSDIIRSLPQAFLELEKE
ncbi:NAD(P)H-hydrate dehydratase [Sphingobacterium faecale]|uniref:Bifunctional NAD(P)H-hydrate repair enzyme n=1 Tax=Sphingobacterium faecale TaxID=2803775 RepID=A0ABS1QXH2_9SPHI|nr:NAD(P)H-hydrate dehydratase [Sphingobacterium faecale]MBL1407132.1 NAD(P)H-hydrate dehydratase [Sphingobacterium faecale]